LFYIVYRITNLLDGKVYVGKHQTEKVDDGYMGSGKYLRRALEKHGKESFAKEILYVFETEEEMNSKEAELVTEEFCAREDTYNICPGGKGGWGYVNDPKFSEQMRAVRSSTLSALYQSEEFRERRADALQKIAAERGRKHSSSLKEKWKRDGHPWTGKSHSEETKNKISAIKIGKYHGEENSQHGTMWITDGVSNKKVKKDLDTIPEGWYKGRMI